MRNAHASGIHRKLLPSSSAGGSRVRIEATAAVRASAAATAAATGACTTVSTPMATARAATPKIIRARHRSPRPDDLSPRDAPTHILAAVSTFPAGGMISAIGGARRRTGGPAQGPESPALSLDRQARMAPAPRAATRVEAHGKSFLLDGSPFRFRGLRWG